VTDPATLSALDGCLQDYKDCFEAGGEVVLVANKMDLVDGGEALREGQEYADLHRCGLFGTSTKSGAGIEELFIHIADRLASAAGPGVPPELPRAQQSASGVCC
jgi:50S ribosomal subunit-associated GTPase HflX